MTAVFQSSFELTGYITGHLVGLAEPESYVSKLFRAYRLYNEGAILDRAAIEEISKLFRAYRLYNNQCG